MTTPSDAPAPAAAALQRISVVVPVGPGEHEWTGLLDDLRGLPPAAEVLCVGAAPPGQEWNEAQFRGLPAECRWVESSPGRARQMNAGARAASRDVLWFLHADSRFAADTLSALGTALSDRPDALHFFRLAFAGGPRLMRLTEWGTRLRAERLGLPFGDQGLSLPREAFETLGGYDESAPYGEDHLLVWAAHRRGLSVRCTGGTLLTSARKYREHGWCRTTARHFALTWTQALPQWRRMRRERTERRRARWRSS